MKLSPTAINVSCSTVAEHLEPFKFLLCSDYFAFDLMLQAFVVLTAFLAHSEYSKQVVSMQLVLHL